MKSGNGVVKSSVNTVSWSLALFGTAVGAGVLFLPIQVGQSGFWPLLLVAVLIYPTIYLGHCFYGLIPDRAADRLDYTAAVSRLLPRWAGSLLSVLYLGWLLILLIAYSISLTNDVGDFLATRHLLSHTLAHRIWLSLAILTPLFLLLRFARLLLVRILGGLTLLLIGLLCLVSVSLIPHWNVEVAASAFALPSAMELLKQFLLLFPLLTLSFMFFPILSSLVLYLGKVIPDPLPRQIALRRIIALAVILLMGFLLIFVLSFMLAIPKAQFLSAATDNISALALLGNIYEGTWLGDLGPAISVTALLTSFFGIFIGYRDAILPTIARRLHADREDKTGAGYESLVFGFTFPLLWVFGVANVPVMDILGDLVAPLGAVFLLLVPAGIVLRLEVFVKERGVAARFVFAAGVLVLLAYFAGSVL